MAVGQLALGIDVGTTNVKAALVADGDPPSVVARASVAHPTRRTRPGWSEQDPADWRRGTIAAIAALGRDSGPVTALAVSGQGSTICLRDATGRALVPAVGWQDQRATAEAAAIEQALGADLARAHGNAVGDAPEPKLVWLAREDEATVRQANSAISAAAWISAELGAQPVLNEGDAGSWLSWNRHDRRWDDRIAGALGLERLLPEVVPLGTPVGELGEGVARETGLPVGIPLVASTTDVAAAAIAAGACGVGDVFYSKGTGGFVCATVEAVPDPAPLLALPVGNGTVQLCAVANTVGAAYDWVCGLLGVDRDEAERLAAAAPPGSGGLVVLPWLQGTQHPLLAPGARGVAFGLALETGRGELVRAVLEGTALELRRNLDAARRVAGYTPASVVASGGPTRSVLWSRLDAAAVELPLVVAGESDAAVGSALVAGEAAGLWPDALEAGRATASGGTRYEPEEELLRAARSAAALADEVAGRTLPLYRREST
jgi:xylulokinase